MSADFANHPPPREYDLGTGKTWTTATHSPEETQEVGRRLAQQLEPPCVILLEGELGTGKTTLTKGIVEGLGVACQEDVTSPSFALVHEYGAGQVYHVDLYRIETTAELETLGLDDILGGNAIVLVEWGEKLGRSFAGPALWIRLEYAGGDHRRITVEAPAKSP
jgi:tRNA threonylcarbamoyladenosine biosynthesis protein TsaE